MRSALSWLSALELKIKPPIVEAGVTLVQPQASTVKKLRRVERRITKKDNPFPFQSVPSLASVPPIFRFHGPGAKLVSGDDFWLASYKDDVALILVGSMSNAYGSTPSGPRLSPSINVLEAIQTAAGSPSAPGDSVEAASSYAWQAILRSNGQKDRQLPTVTGLAFCETFAHVNKAQIRRAGIAGIEHIVIGSPLFIEQV
jgi:hypothetical protein